MRQRCDKGEFDIKHDVTLVVMNAVLSKSKCHRGKHQICFVMTFHPITDTTFGREISREASEGIMTKVEKYVLHERLFSKRFPSLKAFLFLHKKIFSKSAFPSIFRLLDIVWKRSMNPLLYYDSIYSITSMKKQEDSHRQFIFDFISNEWNKLIQSEATSSEMANSFIHQLIRISNEGRNFTTDEVNDHVGTMLVAVSQTLLFTHSILTFNLCLNEGKAFMLRS